VCVSRLGTVIEAGEGKVRSGGAPVAVAELPLVHGWDKVQNAWTAVARLPGGLRWWLAVVATRKNTCVGGKVDGWKHEIRRSGLFLK